MRIPGTVHLAGSDIDVRCLDVDAYHTTTEPSAAKLCMLSLAADLVADVADPGQLLAPGSQRIPWNQIAWISMRDPLTAPVDQPQPDGGDR